MQSIQSSINKKPGKQQGAKKEHQSVLRWSPNLFPPALLLLFWLFSFCFVGIWGNFPLNDDWIYSEAVQHFVDTGELRLLACAPACLFQILAASVPCKIFGFNYELLRATGFAWAILASFALYGSLRELRLRPFTSLFFTMCLAANPLFFNLAFSFMTDTPALALCLSYIYFLLKGLNGLNGLRNSSEKSLWLASLCLIAACFVRQNLSFLALVNAVLLILLWARKKHSWAMLLGLVILPGACGFFADKWLVNTNDLSSVYLWYKNTARQQLLTLLHAPGRLLPILVQICGELAIYLGLFALPILSCFTPLIFRFFAGRGMLNPITPVVSASLIVYSLCRFILLENRWMPFSLNLLRIPELGAHSILGINHAELPARWKQSLTWMSSLAAFVLITVVFDTLLKTSVRVWRLFRRPNVSGLTDGLSNKRLGATLCASACVLIFLLEFAFNVLQSSFCDIDRYYLFPFLGVLLVLALAWRQHRVKLHLLAFMIPLAGIASYSVAATQDMMAWNRARWAGIAMLEKQGVSYKQIDGGAEYNFASDPSLSRKVKFINTWYEFTDRGEPPRNAWRWWTVSGEDYIISFSPVPEYEVIAKQEYWSALAGKREILVLKHVKSK